MCTHNIIKIIIFAVFALLFTVVFISDFIYINFNKVNRENKKPKIHNK